MLYDFQIFSLILGCIFTFTFLTLIFKHKVFNLDDIQFMFVFCCLFVFCHLWFGVMSNTLPNSGIKICSYIFLWTMYTKFYIYIMIHSEIVFVFVVKWEPKLSLMHMDIHLSQHYLLKYIYIFFFHCIILTCLSKISFPLTYAFISGIPIHSIQSYF